jgi:glutamine synthetase
MMTEASGTDMERRIESADIDHVFIEFPDINSISRSKQISADYFLDSWRSGFRMNLLLLVQTPRSDVPSGSGYGEEINFGDGIVHPDPATFRVLPWRDDAARVICDIEYQGEPVLGAPRSVLKRVREKCDFPFDITVGSELEFFLLDSTEDGYEPATSHKHECVSWATEEVTPFYDRLTKWADSYGVDITSLQHEHGAGQLEILFDHGSMLSQADTTFDFKRLVKQTARAGDQYATFMAKPFGDRAGSGYHLHIGAFEGNENAFADDGRLSTTARHFVGGLLEHADALSAVGTPTLNAFKRYQPGSFAPYTASWGLDNRMTAIRIPPRTPRIENRIASADANPYLVIASTLAAGMHGIREEIDPGDPLDGDPADHAPLLPQSPELALRALQRDSTMNEMLGEEFIREYTASKQCQMEKFRSTVTPWEREQYVETL